MKQELRIIMVGAGGVASYLLPALQNSFGLSGLLFDKDALEPHNLDRQVFDPDDVGRNKAEALVDITRSPLKPVPEFFEELTLGRHGLDGENFDLLLCVADNHPARRDCLRAADNLAVPCFIAANEYSTSQAMAHYLPWAAWRREADPRQRYPELLTSDEGSPLRCAGEALESTPQLAIANQVSAALVNYLIWQWMGDPDIRDQDPMALAWMPVEFQTTASRVETVTLGDFE